MRMCWCRGVKIHTWSCGVVHIFVQQGEGVCDMNAFSFLVFIVCHSEETGNTTQRVFCVWVCVFVCVCVCARVWETCSHQTRRALLMAVHSLIFGQTSCRYMSSSRWLQVNLARFLVIILPAAENMRFGAAEVAGTALARTFLPKRAVHGTTDEARQYSVRGFLCDGQGCRRILHKAVSLSTMSELTTVSSSKPF